MDILHALEVGLDQPDQSLFGNTSSQQPSPMPLPPALPGSPTLPPSGAVTPAQTVPPSPTLPPEPEEPAAPDTPAAQAVALPSPPTTPHASGFVLPPPQPYPSHPLPRSPSRSPSHLPHRPSQQHFHSQVRKNLDDYLIKPGPAYRRIITPTSTVSCPTPYACSTGQCTPTWQGAVEDEAVGHVVLGSRLHDRTRISNSYMNHQASTTPSVACCQHFETYGSRTRTHALGPSCVPSSGAPCPSATSSNAQGTSNPTMGLGLGRPSNAAPRPAPHGSRSALAETTMTRSASETLVEVAHRSEANCDASGCARTQATRNPWRRSAEADSGSPTTPLGSRPPPPGAPQHTATTSHTHSPNFGQPLGFDDNTEETLGVLGLAHSCAPIRPRAHDRGHEVHPSTGSAESAGQKSDSSKRNAVFSDASPLDDVSGWLNYLAHGQAGDMRTPSILHFPDLTVDTSIYGRRASDAGLMPSSGLPPRLSVATTVSGGGATTTPTLSSGTASTESYIRDWRQDISPSGGGGGPACSSPGETSLSSASSSTNTSNGAGPTPDRALPPQAPPPKRPLPLLPDPPARVPGMLLFADDANSTILQRRASARRPSATPTVTASPPHKREGSTRTEKDVGGGITRGASTSATATSATASSIGRARGSSRASRPEPLHPFAAHPFAAATPESVPPPLRRRAGSVSSLGLGSPSSQGSPSARSFGSIHGHQHHANHSHSGPHHHAHGSGQRTADPVQGTSTCSPTRYLGNVGAPSEYQQATWLFAPRSPEARLQPQGNHGQGHSAGPRTASGHELGHDEAHEHDKVSTAKRRFASVTFRGDHSHGHDHHHELSERERLRKEKKERRSSGYFDSKSDFAFGEGRAKSFMRKIAAWAR